MKTTVVVIIVFLLCSCVAKEKPLMSLDDFRNKYENMTQEELAEREIGDQNINFKLIALDKSYLKEDKVVRYIDTTILLPLETTDECLISNIDKVIFQNQLFYVFDKRMRNLFVFDHTGKYCCKISAKGRGPGEYETLIDFCVSENGNVYLLDNISMKILIYDSKGNFINDIALKHKYISMICHGNNIVLTSCAWNIETNLLKKDYRIDLLDLKGNLKKQLFSFNPEEENAPWNSFNLGIRVNSDDHFIYFPSFGNQIFLIDSLGKLEKSYLIEMENYSIPPYLTLAIKNEKTFSDAYAKYRKAPYSYATTVVELDDYLFTDIVVGPAFVHVVYNKKTDIVEGIFPSKAVDISGAEYIGIATIAVGGMPGNILIGWNSVSVLRIFQEVAQKENISFDIYNKLINNMNESDNPALVLVKVKMECFLQ